MSEPETPFRTGYVGLLGRPNAGKSTLLNRVLGSKLAITSPRPQTTRHRIAGIHTDERCQLVMLDTPGIHEAWTELNRQMVQRALDALAEVDVVCWVVDAPVAVARQKQGLAPLDGEDVAVIERLRARGRPIVFVPNKVDQVHRPQLLPLIAAVSAETEVATSVPVSATTGEGVDGLVSELCSRVPEGPALFPPDEWAQVSERFLVGEVVREKAFHLLAREVPYATHVEVRAFDESVREEQGLVRIHADVIVERESQKGIVIGKGGSMLKKIGSAARQDLEEMLGCRVYLELKVRVERDWSKSAGGLRRVGF
ncbi:MAG: GTPase Era [Alphaproteobacteria bacterium]|nr:GTPase Era [Alphaproteobacteria bacterium]MCB9698306.1 GTPase Era [Alphaproteobacteria bacterium]